MKKIIGMLTALLLVVTGLGGAWAEETDRPVIRITVQDTGVLYAELYPETAPVTVENFLKLTDSGFYDGLTFHRIISGFMVQGGDPLGNGTGGSEENIQGEFSANGFENPLAHSRGVLSMARSSDPNSASSQFFIMHADAPHLDGNYAAFGKVLAGMNVVDALCRDTPVVDSNGTVEKADQPVILEVRRVNRAEAEEAAVLEAQNGQSGIYQDSVLGISFPVPEGWSLQPMDGGSSLTFMPGEGKGMIQVAVQDLWRRFGSAFRVGMEAEGKKRIDMGTEYFGEELTQYISGAGEVAFALTEYGGIPFYSGETVSGDDPVWLRIGVADGKLMCFIAIGEDAGEAVDQMTAGLAVETAE